MTTVNGENVPNRNVEVVSNGSGEIIKLGPVTLRVLEDGSNTDNRIGAVEISVPPQTKGPPQHWHQMHDETFLVLTGEVTFTSRTRTVVLKAGEFIGSLPNCRRNHANGVVVPPMAPHTFANSSDAPATMFNSFTPAYYVNYFRVMSTMAAKAQSQLTPEILREAMLRYGTLQTKDHGYEF